MTPPNVGKVSTAVIVFLTSGSFEPGLKGSTLLETIRIGSGMNGADMATEGVDDQVDMSAKMSI
jgi:hypothetical protein